MTTKIEAPRYTQTPNAVFEDILPLASEAELKVMLVIVRQTFGWHKEKDRLSLTQLQKRTGMSRQGVINGVEAGLERGTIGRDPDGRGGFFYYVVVDEADHLVDDELEGSQRSRPEVVNEVDQGSQRSRPEVVNEVDTQKKDKETNKRKRKEGADAPPAPVQVKQKRLDGMPKGEKQKRPEEVEVYRTILGRYPRKDVWTDIVERVAGRLEAWEAACKAWKLQGYKPTNYQGIFDWVDEIPDYAKPNGGKPNGRSNSRGRRGGRPRQTHEEHLAEVRAEARRLEALGVQ